VLAARFGLTTGELVKLRYIDAFASEDIVFDLEVAPTD